LNCCNGVCAEKNYLLADSVMSLTDYAFVSIQYQSVTDRQTDRQIGHNNIALCLHGMLTRDKNLVMTIPEVKFQVTETFLSGAITSIYNITWIIPVKVAAPYLDLGAPADAGRGISCKRPHRNWKMFRVCIPTVEIGLNRVRAKC